MTSAKKMVVPMGTATATKFLSIPLVTHRQPCLSCRNLTVPLSPLLFSFLNISFRTTSAGLVSVAPAIPAQRLFPPLRNISSFFDAGGGKFLKKALNLFLTPTATTYFGTVFIIPADVPYKMKLNEIKWNERWNIANREWINKRIWDTYWATATQQLTFHRPFTPSER